MAKSKRRYTKREQIIDEIGKYQLKASDLDRSADSMETISLEHSKLAALQRSPADEEFYREKSREELSKARRLRITSRNIRDNKLHVLGEKLSEMMTVPMIGIIQDESVEE